MYLLSISIDQDDQSPCGSCDAHSWPCLVMVEILTLSLHSHLHPPLVRSSTRRTTANHPTSTMASSSNVPATEVSKADARKMAEEWETKVCRFIQEDDKDTWKRAQHGLYNKLVSSRRGCDLHIRTSPFLIGKGFNRLEAAPYLRDVRPARILVTGLHQGSKESRQWVADPRC